jgi:uncharacterized membrane protein YbjE (DUF340 family)
MKKNIKQLISKYWIILMALVFVLGFVIGNSGNSDQGKRKANTSIPKKLIKPEILFGLARCTPR